MPKPEQTPEDKLSVISPFWSMKVQLRIRERDVMLVLAQATGKNMTTFVREAVLEHIKRTKRKLARDKKAAQNG